jgi:hypothetical protein
MSLNPICITDIRELNKKHTEKKNSLIVQETIKHIYQNVVIAAEKNGMLEYSFLFPALRTEPVFHGYVLSTIPGMISYPIIIRVDDIKKNMPSILSELKVLFPEYVIEFKKNAAHENEILVKWA